MASTLDDLLGAIARLSETDRLQLMVELGRRYGLPDPGSLAPEPAPRLFGEVGDQPDYRVVFDGGSRGNPGHGYGSYVLSAAAGGPMPLVRVELGERMTNNEAEYDTLIAALQDLLARIGAAGRKAGDFSVEVCGDSQLVISQIGGSWKVRDPRMRTRCHVARQLLQGFRAYRLVNRPREEIVRVLGH